MRIVIAMSGGVDSSVAASLLAEGDVQDDAMLVQLDPAAQGIATSTRVPGADRLTLGDNDEIYIAGRTQTAIFPLVDPLPPSPTGLSEIFLGRVTGRPLSGLTLEVADTGDPVAVGEPFAYRYTSLNNGDTPISALMLTSELPAGFATSVSPHEHGPGHGSPGPFVRSEF